MSVLLLSPLRLFSDHIALEGLHIVKSTQKIDYVTKELNVSEIRHSFPDLDKQAKEALSFFNKESIRLAKEEISKKFSLQRAGIAYDIYYKNAIARKLQELFEKLKPFAALLKWYHKVPADDRIKTGPCCFSNYKPRLHFDVAKEKEGITLNIHVNINGTDYPLKEFKRYHFLLESRNEYFLLSFKDYQVLEWLHENNPSQYSKRPEDFVHNILSHLEADHDVNRNDLFEKNVITVEPVNRVMLSEISNSFLMLTPQWIYDGFVIDGNWNENYHTILNGNECVIKRNRGLETAFVQLLESLHPNFKKQLNGYYYLSFADAQKSHWFAKSYHKLLGLNIQVAGMDMLKHFRYSPHPIHTVVKTVKTDEHTILLNMSVSFGEEEVPLIELQKMVQSGQKAVVLKDGALGVLSDEWIRQYEYIVRHGKISKKEIEVPRWLAFSEQPATGDLAILKPSIQKSWWEKWIRWQEAVEPVYPVPSSVHATLRPYQQKGFEWISLLSEANAGACLADDMGLGKTLQTICFLAHQLQKDPDKKHLIVCPSSLIYNWQQELNKFAPLISVLVYHGIARNIEWMNSNEYQIIITSYGTLRSDIEILLPVEFGVTVLDESHHIKNPAAQITRAVMQLHSRIRIALSGTPVMNNTFDLYAQLNFLLPGLFGSREFFKREYADAIDRDHDIEKIKALQKITSPFILRRTKEQVAADLPAKTEMIMWCEMSAEQKTLYESIKESISASLFLNIKKEGLNKSKLAVLQGILKLRQICNSPLLLPQNEQTCSESIKTDLLMEELANNLNDHKALVFSQFSSMLHLLAEACRNRGIAFYHFDGQTPPAKRIEMVERFQQQDSPAKVFLISLKAGNTGLNLTAADYVFLFDPWWNTAVQQQAIDRTHRIGQTKNVFAYKMICKDTIEEKIIQLQQRKKKLAEDLISEEEGFVKSLSEEDIAYLFS